MKASIYISGRITKNETLKDVIRQYKSFEDPTEVTVYIKSKGGNKDEGNAVYDYLKNIDSEIPVTTYAEQAYSIAAKIFAAGSTRIAEDNAEVVGVHFASVTPKGSFTAEEMSSIADELFEIKKEFIDFYSDHLGIDKVTVENLLENETIMSGKEAVDLGFATEVKEDAEIVAELYIDNSNTKKMAKSDNSKGRTLLEAMAEFVGYEVTAEGKLKKKIAEVTAELTLQDSNGTEIVFPDLEENATPQVGDKATVEGSEITDGSYIMPSLEDATVVFVGGQITEIIPKEEESETEAEVEARYQENKKKIEIKAETEGLEISTWSMRLVNDTFAQGDVVKYYDWEDNESLVTAAEIKLPDGRTIVTDASGVIVLIKEADSEEQVLENETEANFEELLEKVTEKVSEKIKDEVTAEFEVKLTEKDKEIKALKAKIGGKEFKAEIKEDGDTVLKTEEKGASRFLKAAKEL